MGKEEKFLSMKWFKERAEKAIDKVLEERINNSLVKLATGAQFPVELRPFRTIKLVNDSLTIVLKDGRIFNKPNANQEDYEKAKLTQTVEEIMAIIEDRAVVQESHEIKEEAVKLTNIINGFKMLSTLKDFEAKDNTLFLRGTSRTIPPLLIDKFTEVVGKYTPEEVEKALLVDDEYQGLKNFFMWCCLNPRAEVASSLYDFLDKNGMKITKQGFFVALRNVVEVKDAGNSHLVQFVSNAYNKVKAVWKKSPKDFRVMANSDDTFSLEKVTDTSPKGAIVGNLSTLYTDLPNMSENRFTDNWTKTFDIRIGQVVSMPSEKCDWSTQDCARAGLHFAGHTAPYVLCGDTTVFTLHNPMKVVGIGSQKGRCWEYLPFMTTNIKEADQIMNSKDFDFLQLDENYAILELEGLAEKARNGFTVESTKYNFNIPSMSTAEINSIVLSLEEMKKSITKRVSLIE